MDNTYGTSIIGWPGPHKFTDLTGSDRVQMALYDMNGVLKMEFKLDYFTASAAAPSGYKSLGVTGGDGGMITGNASDVLSAKTSMDVNFNDNGYVLITNSPVTNSSYAPNATYPNWIYDVWYDVTVSLSAFPDGFGQPLITAVHASPSKTGSNSEVLDDTICDGARARMIHITNTTHPKSLTVDAYPNPFGDNITIDFVTPSDEGDANISITDIAGRVVESFTHPSGKINTGSNLKPGVYFVTVSYDDHQQVIKIVKTGYNK